VLTVSEEILANAESRMKASLKDYHQRLGTVRTGRASLGILDRVSVDYYGTPTPLNQVAKLAIPDPTLITAQPFDPGTMRAIEKAVMTAGLGLNPSNDGKVIRIPIPPLTEERRKQLVKKVHALREEAKTAVRQIRREANEEIKRHEKEGQTSEDDARRARDEIQKSTDEHTATIDEVTKNKESELLEI
jgi:ribosome recycling factor